ncbi:MAG: pyridoxal phosphate-dependent aminotransferase [Clostridiales bacterium]|jgi:aspartate aminotransferase|nr:pyridoxal phosphate-dependent aminotransferase [Clostridiales bacterium]
MKLSEKAKQVKESSTLAITAKAKQMAADGIDLAAFTAGEPDFDTPQHIKDAAIKAINDGFTKYTASSGTVELRKAICTKFKNENGLSYTPAQIVVSNGAKHSLTNAFMAILNPGDEVMVPVPYWLSYPEMVHIAGGTAVPVNSSADNGYKLTRADLDGAYTSKTKAIILNSPSNPTGAVYSKAELQVVADFAVEKDIFIIADEIYEKLVYSGVKHISIATLGEEVFKRTIVINGFSKGYAMTGWRMGYAAAPTKEIADIMGNLQSHMTSNPNSITQVAAVAALLGDQSSVSAMRVEFEKRRDYIYDRASKIPHIKVIKPDGAFYLYVGVSGLYGKNVKGVDIKSAKDVADVLISDYGTVVVPCADFGAPDHIRLSYAISMANITKGMDRIEQFVKENY